MLIDRVMSFCDSEYRNAHRNTRCEDCLHTGDCSRNCKDCLEEIHYPSRHPNGKKFYDCPHLINFYVCDYAYKYATEIYYLLQKSDALAEIEHYSIFSIGCGACPDLMAFELYLQRNAPGKTLEYRGIDKNPLWESIHNQVLQYTTADITYINLSTEDAFTFLEQFAVGDINVLVLQYIISALYVSKGPCAVDKLFDLIIDSIVKHKAEDAKQLARLAENLDCFTLVKEESGYERYKNVTLYASWTKASGDPENPGKDMVKELQSTGETKEKIEFATEVSKDYKLDIKSIEVKKELADKNVKFVADINVLDGNNNVVKISNIKMKIRIALPENLKRYDKYEIVYISNGEIKETISAAVENGYIVFETNHLSQYGIIATNTGNGTKSPQTGDNSNLALWFAVLFISGGVLTVFSIASKKKRVGINK